MSLRGTPGRSIKVNVRPVADRYAGNGERIVEFSSPAGGGLISFFLSDAGKLLVDVYRCDETVLVHGKRRP